MTTIQAARKARAASATAGRRRRVVGKRVAAPRRPGGHTKSAEAVKIQDALIGQLEEAFIVQK